MPSPAASQSASSGESSAWCTCSPPVNPLSEAHRRFLIGLTCLMVVMGIMSLFVPGTMESSGPLERAQLRWFFVGSAMLTLMFAVFTFVADTEGTLLSLILNVLFLLGFWSLPAAIVVAILRYRLYDIDRILSRTASYVIIVGVLAAVYALGVLALQAVLPVGSSQIAIAASTLGAAALFAPLRNGVQRRLDHRFNRAHFEAQLVTQEFGRRLQREIDPAVIQRDLEQVIVQTMHPAEVRVWLRG